MADSGKLYGIGVGPGDPELLTLKACALIRSLDAIAYPTDGEGHSLARSIAADVIPAESDEIPIHVPMVQEREPGRAAFDQGALEIAGHLDAGRHVGYLCVGDPLFYGSFIYLAARLGEKHPIEVVPGVTSLGACAARLGQPLAARNEVFRVIPAPLSADQLTSELANADSAAVIKVGRHFEKVRGVLRALDLASRAGLVAEATGEGETITPVEEVPDDAQGYFSTILVRRRDPQW